MDVLRDPKATDAERRDASTRLMIDTRPALLRRLNDAEVKQLAEAMRTFERLMAKARDETVYAHAEAPVFAPVAPAPPAPADLAADDEHRIRSSLAAVVGVTDR